MLNSTMHKRGGRLGVAILGACVYSIGINLFVVPAGLITGGMMGFCQLLRSGVLSLLGIGALPFDLAGATLFYAGPTPAAAGRPLGSVGPTTASRMDFATPQLFRAGIVAAIGKGKRSPEVVEACRREKVRLLIFSNPCNPTSLALDREAVRHILKGVEALVVLDEAYMDFSDQSLLEEASQYSNLIILRTCSKALGMAAARLGFAAANPKLAGALRAAKAPYNVNAMSQALGLAALRRGDLLDQARAQVLASRDQLLAGLRALAQARPGRFRVLPCAANFAALVMPQAQRAQELLLSRGVAVRFTGGLLRVTCGQPEENRRFLQEFEKIWEELP